MGFDKVERLVAYIFVFNWFYLSSVSAFYDIWLCLCVIPAVRPMPAVESMIGKLFVHTGLRPG